LFRGKMWESWEVVTKWSWWRWTTKKIHNKQKL